MLLLCLDNLSDCNIADGIAFDIMTVDGRGLLVCVCLWIHHEPELERTIFGGAKTPEGILRKEMACRTLSMVVGLGLSTISHARLSKPTSRRAECIDLEQTVNDTSVNRTY